MASKRSTPAGSVEGKRRWDRKQVVIAAIAIFLVLLMVGSTLLVLFIR